MGRDRETRRCVAPVVLGMVLGGGLARGDPPGESANVTEARRLFVEGTELVKVAHWAEALSSFEASARSRPHAVTTFNVGACERALGRYTRARESLLRALAAGAPPAPGAPGELSSSLATEAHALVDEIDRVLAHVTITIAPREAAIAVDGRPLAVVDGGATSPLLVAGTQPPGLGKAAPAETFELLLDPGAHVFLLARQGYSDVVLNQTFAPGAHLALALRLDLLPATLHVSSNQEAAIVTVDSDDVGPVPVDLRRAAGAYKIAVKKRGFVTYRAQVIVKAGEEVNLRAALEVDRAPVYKKWWFWSAAGVVLTGVGIGVYYATRPEPSLDGGGLGWAVKVR